MSSRVCTSTPHTPPIPSHSPLRARCLADHGAYYHAVAEEGVAFREIAEVIGRRLSVPVVSKNREEASGHFTWFAHFAALNILASSEQTQAKLAWRATQPGLIADLDRPGYFAA